MKRLSIDIETYCELDLKDVGVYKYVEHPSFEVLMIAWAVDDDPVKIFDLKDQSLPLSYSQAWDAIESLLLDKSITKYAFNAQFERLALSKWLKQEIPPEEWVDTMALAAMLGLPTSLDKLGAVIGGEGYQKDKVGKSLISYFSKPCKPTKVNEGRTRNLPKHDMEKWKMFLDYCVQDVEVERNARKKLEKFKVDPQERKMWIYDQRINDRGIKINLDYVDNTVEFYEDKKEELLDEIIDLTGVSNPQSIQQLNEWLESQDALILKEDGKPTLAKDYVKAAHKEATGVVKRVLKLRLQTSLTSIKKLVKMKTIALERNGRACGCFQFFGAQRTGRWAGRQIQFQNMKRIYIKDYDYARQLMLDRNYAMFDFIYDDPVDIISQLVRTYLEAGEGKLFYVADFSAIEARVIAWLANERWRIDVFKGDGLIYEASAEMMFGVPKEDIMKGGSRSELRQQGKVAELALGYQGGEGAIDSMDFNNDIPAEDRPRIIKLWREASPNIVKWWKDLENAARNAIRNPGQTFPVGRGVSFGFKNNFLRIQLPSKRVMYYPEAKIKRKLVTPKNKKIDPFEVDAIVYRGKLDSGNSHWAELQTYGGKLAENITQAVARDVLRDKLIAIEERLPAFKTVGHVHDEVITEADEGQSLDDLNAILAEPVSWGDDDLVLTAEGYVSKYFKKD